jgi:hypothetical protein
MMMKILHAATLVAGVSVTAALGFGGQATAAPSGPSTVGSIVNALQADGYTVILNRTGSAPLSSCTISAVRPGQEVIRKDSGVPGDSLTTTVVSKSVHVDVKC